MTSQADETVDVVDELGNTIGVFTRQQMREGRLPHRCTYVLVFNTHGELFVHLRTATKDVSLAGQCIEAGQKVQIWEGSANRDASVFEDPDVFDIARKPNPHLGFGQGVHYCLGANLARLELRVLFEELLRRFASVKVVEPVEWTRSNRHTGIRHLVVELQG